MISDKDNQVDWCRLPERLSGDQIRFKQVLINLVKHILKHKNDEQLTIKARFDNDKQLMVV